MTYISIYIPRCLFTTSFTHCRHSFYSGFTVILSRCFSVPGDWAHSVFHSTFTIRSCNEVKDCSIPSSNPVLGRFRHDSHFIEHRISTHLWNGWIEVLLGLEERRETFPHLSVLWNFSGSY